MCPMLQPHPSVALVGGWSLLVLNPMVAVNGPKGKGVRIQQPRVLGFMGGDGGGSKLEDSSVM